MHPLGAQLLPREARPRLEGRGVDQVDPVALAVPVAADERDDVEPVPDVRTDVGDDEAELLVQLASQRRLVVLTWLLAAARRRPDRDVGELEAHEQHADGRIEHHGAHGRADPQPLQVPLHGAAAYSAGWSGKSPLKARYIS